MICNINMQNTHGVKFRYASFLRKLYSLVMKESGFNDDRIIIELMQCVSLLFPLHQSDVFSHKDLKSFLNLTTYVNIVIYN